MLTALLGTLVGLALGLTGAGGGVLSVPLLVFGLHVPMATAGPVGLVAIALAAGLGAALGLREGVVRYRAAGVLAVSGMLLTPFGVWCAQRVPNRPLALLFAVVLVLVSVRMLRQARQQLKHSAHASPFPAAPPCLLDSTSGRFVWTLRCARAMAAAGTLSGFLSGLLGVGGGFVIVPALQMVTQLPMRSIIATSLAAITLVSLAGVATAAWLGSMTWSVALPFGAGAALGLLAGRQLARHLAGPRLQQGFALLGLLVAGLMVLRVG